MDFLVVRDLGLKSYHSVLDDMQRFTRTRTRGTVDEIWYVQHPAVYTRGVSCHDLPWGDGRDLELVDSDRGGLALTFFSYFFVNAAMVAGMLPVVGVPLPLVSYGGTSMLTLMAAFGIMMGAYTRRGLMT